MSLKRKCPWKWNVTETEMSLKPNKPIKWIYFRKIFNWSVQTDVFTKLSVKEWLLGTGVWGVHETCPVSMEILLNKNMPSLKVYVDNNQGQLFHMSDEIIWLTNWNTSVHLNSFRPINLLLHLICLSFKNTFYIKIPNGVLEVHWGPEILT